MINYEIRSVTERELPACLETIHAAFAEMPQKYGYTRQSYPTSAAYLTLEELVAAKQKGVHMYAAFVGDVVAGYVQLDKKRDGVYAFRRFSVLPAYQSIGIGRALVNHCAKRMRSFGGRKMELVMANCNVSLRGFYEGYGFRTVKIGRSAAYPFEYALMELEL